MLGASNPSKGLEKAKAGIEEITETYKEKVSKSVLPPDPARVIKAFLRGPVTIEHLLPIPPILEVVHSDVIEPFIEELPRLPLTGDYPIHKWKEWIKE